MWPAPLRVLAFSALHFVLAMAFAFLTYGSDLDQLRSRSALSRSAGHAHDLLWFPHDAILRAIPNALLVRPGVIPAVLLGASLLWGMAAFLLVEAARRRRAERSRRGSSQG